MNPLLGRLIHRVRQSHALEHATLHLLARTPRPPRLVGRSDGRGFWLYGDVHTPVVRRAVADALRRLKAGQGEMAVHPRCGTNLAVSALVTGTVVALASAAIGTGATRGCRIRRSFSIGAAALGASAAAQPLGLWVQRRWMTTPDLAEVRIRDIRRQDRGGLIVHRVRIDA